MGRHTATPPADSSPTPPASAARGRGESPRRAAQERLRAAEAMREQGAVGASVAVTQHAASESVGGPVVIRHADLAEGHSPRRAAQLAAGSLVHAHRRHVTARRAPRAVTSTAAAMAIVAMTTSTAYAGLVPQQAAQAKPTPKAPQAGQSESQSDVLTIASAPVVPVPQRAQTSPAVDDATFDAASDEIVRAMFLTTEAVGTLTDEQITQIDDVRARLDAVMTSTAGIPVVLAAPGTERELPTSRSGVERTTEELDATVAQEISTLTAELKVLLDGSQSQLAVKVTPPPPTAEELRAEREAQIAVWEESTESYSNGQIPRSALCSLDFAPGALLRCDAAHQLEALNAEFTAEFGYSLSINSSYRSYSAQVSVKAAKGHLAAPPGSSNHGWAVAVDISNVGGSGSAVYVWLRENAPDFGWDHPTWARPGGAKPEPWHWEYGTAM